jgi:hypothetical protein
LTAADIGITFPDDGLFVVPSTVLVPALLKRFNSSDAFRATSAWRFSGNELIFRFAAGGRFVELGGGGKFDANRADIEKRVR